MKTFADLTFEPHRTPYMDGHARLDFPNGYGVSIVKGYCAQADAENPYEFAVFHEKKLCYDTPITDDVCGYLTADDVTDLMRQVQELPAKVPA